ncbi:MAG: hypothetical protein GEU73_08415 [Chloroflexi bacterium]|nr:hypothetical protein [Chloroflexota bacterium]
MTSLTWVNTDRLCAQVDLTESPATVDLSDITFFEPFALIYLGMFLRHHNSQGRRFRVLRPRARAARGYLATQNFWDRFNFDAETVASANLNRLTNKTSLNDIVDIERRSGVAEEISGAVLQMLRSGGARVGTDVVAELVAELVDNFAQHSGRRLAAFMVQRYPNAGRVDVAIGDCGVGIRVRLAAVERYRFLADQPHWEAAAQAFEPLVTSKAEGGTGLTEVRDAIIEAGGHLVLATGDGYVQVSDGATRKGEMEYDLPGVQIEFSFYEQR